MPYIKSETIDKVYEAARLETVIGDYVKLKKAGAQFKGLSPFVKEKTPSFMVSPAKGIWKDFASGKSGTSAVGFVMAKEGMSYPEAIEALARKFGIEVQYDDSDFAKAQQEKQQIRESLQPLLESTIRKYEEEFQKLPKDHPAKIEVYEKRGYTDEIVEAYRIGYAPGNRFIYDKVIEIGRKQDAIDIGLITENADKWKNRVIYPLMDRRGQHRFPVGLAGRRLDDTSKYAKWINSVNSELYTKEKFWYGLDKAREEIVKRGEVWIVEGYNDVIAWQQHGILNTVASSGTAISQSQINLLRKLCDRAIFCMDTDEAGISSMQKYIPAFIKSGFRAHLMTLFPGMDPDDFVRTWKKAVEKESLAELHKADHREDGFKFLMEESFRGKDEVGIAQEAKSLASLISCIEDEAMRKIYSGWLAKESKLTKKEVSDWLKEKIVKNIEKVISSTDEDKYRLPKSVKTPLKDLKPTIERYQMFISENQIWAQQGDEPPYYFKSCSNFSVEILQHMQDEKFPMKLLRIRNVHKEERIFDILSSEINTPLSFENAVTNHGNFRWKAGRKEHELLKTYLFDQMQTGRKVDVLGWQAEGFWVWNNKVTNPTGEDGDLDENGLFEKDKTAYYVPSANQMYARNLYKYDSQKKVLVLPATISFQNYAAQVIKVHREHGMFGVLFTVASIFQDIVVDTVGFFPMLFMFGPASSGKDQLAHICQSFMGKPQTAINLEGDVSTNKAQIREFAQFSNLIAHLSEYKNGNPKLDGILKGLWDRRGYKRGTLDSHVSSESIPILSSVIMTGNYAPDQEALVTRLIWLFMDKTVFTDEEIKDYEKLEDWTKKGISSYTVDFLRHRSLVENNFKNKYREFKATLGERRPEANSRMISNMAVLGTFYQLFQNEVSFPFTHNAMMAYFEKTIDKQMNKLDSASIINRWWDCFLASMRGTHTDQILDGRDFNVSGNEFYFQFTNCYNRVQRQWFTQYRDNAPAKGVMMDALKKDKSWIENKSGHRFGSGRTTKSSSAYVVRFTDIPNHEEILMAIDFQRNAATGMENLFPSPATPENKKENTEEQQDLPF